LPKLSDVKTNNLSINFLHVIVEQFDKIEKEQRLDFIEELKDLGLVTKFVFLIGLLTFLFRKIIQNKWKLTALFLLNYQLVLNKLTKLFYILSTSYANLNNDFNSLKKNLIDLKNKITSDSMKKQFWLRFSVNNKISFCEIRNKLIISYFIQRYSA
jgi:hypothetical protein